MKLFTRYNRVNIAVTILAFVLGSIAFFIVLRYILIKQLDDSLRAEKQEITAYVQQHQALPEIQNTKHQWTTVEETTQPATPSHIQSIHTHNEHRREDEWVRQIIFPIRVDLHSYSITVNKSEEETEDLLQLIILVTVCMIGLILLLNYVVNRRLVTNLWKPFYKTIDAITTYRTPQQEPLQFPKEKIDEIDLLNDSLQKMTENIYRDYYTLRAFAENASHEMQTPLAVIRSAIELLLQQQSEWNEQSIQQLVVIENAIQKLSKLHQSLLLLTKLENRQFVLNEEVNLDSIIREKLEERNELISAKRLKVSVHYEHITVFLHQHLAEILVSNLLNNAIRYTPVAGEIIIVLDNHTFRISNTAVNGALDQEKIFQRFYKADTSTDGTGLGLAIIQEICNAAGFELSYSFPDNKHSFFIQFPGVV